MNITLTGTKITQDTKFLAFEKNNSVDVINITVDTDESWEYKLDVKYPDKCCTGEVLYNIINLTRSGNLCTAILTSDMLPFAGKYTMQLRGINGDKVYHSDTFDCWVKYSIEPASTYDPVPNEFYQIEANITAIEANVAEMNNNPPYPSEDGYWMIWDVEKHTYEKSDIKIASDMEKSVYDPDSTVANAGGIVNYVSKNAVLYKTKQSLTDAQKKQAQENIGAVIPTALPNPNALNIKIKDTITSYDGSDEKTVEIPVASIDDISLGITGAQVGQIAKITAVDENGKPTAWKTVTPEPWNFVMADGTTVTKKVYVDADE